MCFGSHAEKFELPEGLLENWILIVGDWITLRNILRCSVVLSWIINMACKISLEIHSSSNKFVSNTTNQQI